MDNLCEVYTPELSLLKDAYLGNREVLFKKLEFLAKMAEPEQWNYNDPEKEPYLILKNYLFYTYDRVKQEDKLIVSADSQHMCFNTGLQTINGNDIYAYFQRNTNMYAREGQDWYLNGFKQRTDREMQIFTQLPDIADYFTTPADFIFDRQMEIFVDYDHIIDDNFDRFEAIGYSDKLVINALLESAVKKSPKK